MILSILICSLNKRAGMLASLLEKLSKQIEACQAWEKVEVLVEMDNGEKPTGTKRNTLLNSAKGVYVVYADDDDEVFDYYVEEVLKAAEQDCDAMAVCGIMSTNGRDIKKWFIAKDNQYVASRDENGSEIYLRYQNHISPVKREIALQVGFTDKYVGEDYDYANKLHKMGLVKTEAKIEKPIYHYKFVSNKV
jgi:hypothetical protein